MFCTEEGEQAFTARAQEVGVCEPVRPFPPNNGGDFISDKLALIYDTVQLNGTIGEKLFLVRPVSMKSFIVK